MKKTLLFLALAGSLVLPAVTHADTPTAKNKKVDKTARHVAAAQPAAARKRIVYYITDTPRTGSLIPMVYRKYDGRLDSASSAAVYGQTDVANSGQIDVAAALNRIDTSITPGNHHG